MESNYYFEEINSPTFSLESELIADFTISKSVGKLGAKNIISVNRDENLIKEAEIEIGPSPVVFKLGDITDVQVMSRMLKDVDILYHTAALKHVTLAEQNPREAHRINVAGLLNLLDHSEHVKRFVHISSDKAIGVVNCYGSTKLLGEYLVRESNSLYPGKYVIVRCPNFLSSRGSVIDLWKKQINKNNQITITDPEMTRYFVTLQDAAKYIVKLGIDEKVNVNKIYYPLELTHKFNLLNLAKSFIEVYGDSKTKMNVIGALPGEKKHEDYIKDVKLSSKSQLIKYLKNDL